MHRIVEAPRLIGYQMCRIAYRWITRTSLSGDGHRETADCRNRLTEFVVQLVRDQASLLFDALLNQKSHFAPFIQPCLCLMRFALRLYLVLYRLRHPIERGGDFARFETLHRRQAEG